MIVVAVGVLVALALAPAGRAPRRAGSSAGVRRPATVAAGVRRLQSAIGRRGPGDAVAALPDLLELAARSRRAGLALLPSLAVASESLPQVGLGPMLARVEAGSGLSAALDEWASRADHPDVDLVVAVLLLGDESGAAVASRLDSTASTLRQRAALADEVRALTAQTRASAMVVALAPVAFALVVAATDDGFVQTMFGTTVGQVSLAAGLVLDAVGLWWMRRLTRITP